MEKFDCEEIIKTIIMDEDSKLELTKSLSRLEDGYKRDNNNYYGAKYEEYINKS